MSIVTETEIFSLGFQGVFGTSKFKKKIIYFYIDLIYDI